MGGEEGPCFRGVEGEPVVPIADPQKRKPMKKKTNRGRCSNVLVHKSRGKNEKKKMKGGRCGDL